MFSRIVSLIVVLMFSIGCVASLPIKRVANEDLTDLKGKWEGFRNTSGAENHSNLKTTMDIKNDNVPIEARIYFHQTTSGVIEYGVLLDVVDGKLVSRSYNLVFSLFREGNRLQLKGPMTLPRNYHEELTFSKSK